MPAGESREDFIAELLKDDFAFLPGEERAVTELGWGPAPRVVISVPEGGNAAALCIGLPAGVTVELRRPAVGGGAAEPRVSVWEGPLWPPV